MFKHKSTPIQKLNTMHQFYYKILETKKVYVFNVDSLGVQIYFLGGLDLKGAQQKARISEGNGGCLDLLFCWQGVKGRKRGRGRKREKYLYISSLKNLMYQFNIYDLP
jgi:hypothetical protein